MPYRLIKGEFHVHYPDLPLSGPEPDGDTIKFLPDNPSLVDALSASGRSATFNRRGMINLRFEGIDALETHFGDSHQNLNWAEAARDELLARIGFTNIAFAERNPNKIASIDNHPQRGYVLANNLDTFGRIIAFVYVGDAEQVDGAQLFIEEAHVTRSLNYQLLEAGLAYPAFYTSLPTDLRKILAQLVRGKRPEGVGLWPEATANTQQTASFTEGLAEIEELVIWPKLFRRLVSYVGSGFTTLAQFDAWLREDPVNRDDRVLLPNGELGNMHDVIDVISPLQLRMNYEPEDLVIVPDGEIVLPPPAPVKPSIGKSIRIVAALVNPLGKETGQERVTLLNVSPHDQDIKEWTIADSVGKSAPLTELLDSDVIAAGNVVQITLDSRVRLNNTGDTITLFDNNGSMVDQVSYTRKEGQAEGVTLVF
ncbi:lamin tail domain-containing protein [Tunicatimonas pelagia]|uniref:lamin tail domain-containing protein n=1 Tax=Tunicatimonas pelagia TaxID=931531 RepID=UPI002665CECA|nr:lamin tail domain-containing protein [Tunicatimonas pelagia]WKN46303.1 lamin tail domain-containing protein [Tunicatimonas pelagia]